MEHLHSLHARIDDHKYIEDEIEEEIGITIELDELTVKGLKRELRQLGLATSGKKAELVVRLRAALTDGEDE